MLDSGLPPRSWLPGCPLSPEQCPLLFGLCSHLVGGSELGIPCWISLDDLVRVDAAAHEDAGTVLVREAELHASFGEADYSCHGGFALCALCRQRGEQNILSFLPSVTTPHTWQACRVDGVRRMRGLATGAARQAVAIARISAEIRSSMFLGLLVLVVARLA